MRCRISEFGVNSNEVSPYESIFTAAHSFGERTTVRTRHSAPAITGQALARFALGLRAWINRVTVGRILCKGLRPKKHGKK